MYCDKRNSNRGRSRCALIEMLDARRMLSVEVTSAGICSVMRGDFDDQIVIAYVADSPSAGHFTVSVNGVITSLAGKTVHGFRVTTNGGNDSVKFTGPDGVFRALHNTIMGGAGNDTLSGTSGVDRICGEDGNDSITGGGAADKIYGDA